MRIPITSFFVITAPLLLNEHNTLHAHAQFNPNTANGTIHCVDLADFFYEIIIGVSSFPEHGDCSDREHAEIAAFLQNNINKELRAIPGTLRTNNKVCNDPINNRRLQLTPENGPFLFSRDDHKRNQTHGAFTKATLRKRSSLLFWSERNLLRTQRRAFIYVGGGRCRFCFFDNFDNRALSLRQSLSTSNDSISEQQFEMKKHGRNLLFASFPKPKHPYPEVADILLCSRNERGIKFIFVSDSDKIYQYQSSIKLIGDAKKGSFYDEAKNKERNVIGPHVPGEIFGVQIMDIQQAVNSENQEWSENFHNGDKSTTVRLPVRDGQIQFVLYAFDLPTGFRSGMLPDDPLVLFVNGIKLDFKLLSSHPSVTSKQVLYYDIIQGTSFAGIRWAITRWKSHDKDFAYGPEPDRMYRFHIWAPVVVLAHKNQIDIDFMIKPTAKAKKYAIGSAYVNFSPAKCQVTGLENSPFEDFKSSVESKLFHKLGVDLAHEFQGKQGHCLFDKIPVVNVNLVEKQGPKDSNPQCSL